uniref:Si:ch73-127m5.2 n=1 Tax=Amphilophus citrinellus TaxID=61819 RepID=A0A3Q0RJN0_AMPCI
LISYDEIKRRLQAPEKMSLRSLAAYTRVSRGPASKKTLLESLNVLGLTPSTTTSVSSSFSKLTEDTRALCDDMKDFAHDYIDYGNMAKQLIPETNTVQHWSKIIETNHLEDMRKCFKDPVNSGAFDNVTHGLGLGMLDVALDMIIMVIEQQIRILSGAAASDPADSGPQMRRIRRRHRKTRSMDSEKLHKVSGGVKEQGKVISKAKGRIRAKKKNRQETGASGPVETQAEQCKPDGVENNVLTLVSVGYETVSSGLTSAGTV